MEENEKSGYTAEGRKLRPRRPRITDKAYDAKPSDSGDYRGRRGGDYDNRRGGRSWSSGGRNGGSRYDDRGGRDSSQRRSGGFQQRRFNSSYSQQGQDDSHERNSERREYNSEGRFSSEGRRDSFRGRPERRGYSEEGRRPYSQDRGGYRRSDDRRDSDRRGGYRDGESRGGYSSRRPQQGRGGFRSGDRFGGHGFSRDRGYDRGGKRPFRPSPYQFDEASQEGISKMLSGKKVIDQSQISDNDYVPTEIQEEIRLNKFIANSGVCSRREADQFIQAGVVTVNGEVVTELGTKVNVLKDEVRFNGELLKGEPKVYIVMNKPKGFVTTTSDPHADKSVMDLLKGCTARVFPVGRLDKNTTGVLLFTNDGDIAEKLTHPSYDKKKIYQVILDRPLDEADHDKILEGITLGDGDIKADALEYIDAEDHRKLGIEIHSGKNRIVRRIFESLGYDVKALDRVYFAGLTKKGLKKGEWRYLTDGEANLLKMGAYV